MNSNTTNNHHHNGAGQQSEATHTSSNDSLAPTGTETNSQHQRFSITGARQSAASGNFELALLHYLATLRAIPGGNTRNHFLPEFLTTLRYFLAGAEEENDVGEEESKEFNKKVEQIFQLATELFDGNNDEGGELWRLMGEWHFTEEDYLRSLACFEQSKRRAKSDADWVHAAVNVENVRSNLVDFWHWRMLNDPQRNLAFARAIQWALEKRPGARVLDIGSGSGIYSILAARSPQCSGVIACDHDPFMVSVSRECFAASGLLPDRVDLHECHSNALELPEEDKRCEVLVTETFECAVFGEHIAATVADARRRLLKPDAIVIPSKASVVVSLLESDAVYTEHVFEATTEGPNSVAVVSEFCAITRAPPSSSSLSGTLHHNIHQQDWLPLAPPSPYTCNFLAGEDFGGNYRLLSEPLEALSVDFNGPLEELDRISRDSISNHRLELVANATGRVHAVVVWFRITLAEGLELCSAPENGLCWQQAIYPLYPPRDVSPGDCLPFSLSIRQHMLFVVPQFLSTSNTPNQQILRAQNGTDFFALNSPRIRRFFHDAVKKRIKQSRKNGEPSLSPINVIDATDLSVFTPTSSSSSSSAESELFSNDFTAKTVQVETESALVSFINSSSISNFPTTTQTSSNDPLSSIFCWWPFTARGQLNDQRMTALVERRILQPSLQLVPSKIVLRGCLVESKRLYDQSRIVGERDRQRVYCGANLAPMDKYRTVYCHEVEPNNQCRRLSSTTDLLDLDFGGGDPRHDLAQLTQIKRRISIEVYPPPPGEHQEEGKSHNNDEVCHALLHWFALVEDEEEEESVDNEEEEEQVEKGFSPTEKGVQEGNQASRCGRKCSKRGNVLDLLSMEGRQGGGNSGGKVSAYVFEQPLQFSRNDGENQPKTVEFEVSLHHGVVLIDLLSTVAATNGGEGERK